MEKLDNQALTRFERLWKIEGDKLLRANIIPSAVKDGEIYPVDYCISAIARLIQQPHGAEVVCGIRNALSELFEAADTQFIYPDESLHVSLTWMYAKKKVQMYLKHAQINKDQTYLYKGNRKERAGGNYSERHRNCGKPNFYSGISSE
mgnify:CR=1 FL=1